MSGQLEDSNASALVQVKYACIYILEKTIDLKSYRLLLDDDVLVFLFPESVIIDHAAQAPDASSGCYMEALSFPSFERSMRS